MKKCITILLILCLAPLITGCGMFGIGAKTVDGSEAFNEAHPDLNTPPSYMQADPQPLGN